MQYQVRIESTHPYFVSNEWKDRELDTESIYHIVDSVTAHPTDEVAHAKFDLGQLTEIVHEWIGATPDGPARPDNTSWWEEMDYELHSNSSDVVKIHWFFKGWNMRLGVLTAKAGIITIMPGN